VIETDGYVVAVDPRHDPDSLTRPSVDGHLRADHDIGISRQGPPFLSACGKTYGKIDAKGLSSVSSRGIE
jgi:hypothetical protein